jgi:transcriptional regulator with XRE-family HTH domain
LALRYAANYFFCQKIFFLIANEFTLYICKHNNKIMHVGQSIKKIRKLYLGLSQKEFCDKVGITQSYLSQVESGIQIPSSEMLKRISEATNVPLPVMAWMSITEADVHPDKAEVFKQLKPGFDAILEQALTPKND